MGEWVRLDGLDGAPEDKPPPPTDLGGTPSTFPGKPYDRSSLYASMMRDPAATPDERAYALYRAVRCYEPSGENGCGGEAVPKRVRKAWYDALRHDHPTSRWARSLRYWW